MTRVEIQRRQRQARRTLIIAWTVLLAAELAISAIPAALAAAVLLPMALARRGGWAFGAEWLIIAAAFCLPFYAVHHLGWDQLMEEGKRSEPWRYSNDDHQLPRPQRG